jgi:hypothetical protein
VAFRNHDRLKRNDFSEQQKTLYAKDGNIGISSFVFGTRNERDAKIAEIRKKFPEDSCWNFSKLTQVKAAATDAFSKPWTIRYDHNSKKASMNVSPLIEQPCLPKTIEPKFKFSDLATIDAGRSLDLCALVMSAEQQVTTANSGTKDSFILVDETGSRIGFALWRDPKLADDLRGLVGQVTPVYIYNVYAGVTISGHKELSNRDGSRGSKTFLCIPTGTNIGPRAQELLSKGETILANPVGDHEK